MEITTAKFTAEGVIIAIIDGQQLSVPDEMANLHRQELAEWEAQGNTITPYEAPDPREAFRATASMPKAQFCIGMAEIGVLTDEEAIEAAKGNMPATFAATTAHLTAAEQRDVAVRWAAATVVDRADPMLEAFRAYAEADPNLPTITPEQLDTVFGYQEDPA